MFFGRFTLPAREIKLCPTGFMIENLIRRICDLFRSIPKMPACNNNNLIAFILGMGNAEDRSKGENELRRVLTARKIIYLYISQDASMMEVKLEDVSCCLL